MSTEPRSLFPTHGPRGYVLCPVCREEVPEISKATPPDLARCKQHGTWGGDPKKREDAKVEFFRRKKQEREDRRAVAAEGRTRPKRTESAR